MNSPSDSHRGDLWRNHFPGQLCQNDAAVDVGDEDDNGGVANGIRENQRDIPTSWLPLPVDPLGWP